jgi:acetyltransferase-like isoleucine patch superfamily enzyme
MNESVGLVLTEVGTGNRVTGGTDLTGGPLPIEIRGNGNVLEIGPGLEIRNAPRVRIEGDGNTIALGAGVSLHGDSVIRVRGSDNRIAIGARCAGNLRINVPTSGAVFEMGDGCTAVRARFALHEPRRIVLGKDCMLSAWVWLTVSDMHSVIDLETGVRTNPAGSVCLGDHVWLGARVMVLKNVEIGAGSIIGAGAVVTTSIPANCLAAGVPAATIIRRNVSWARGLTTFAAGASAEIEVGAPSRP